MFFAENPHLVRLESSDTAGSVRRVVESDDPTRAAIGSRRATTSADVEGRRAVDADPLRLEVLGDLVMQPASSREWQ